MIDVALVEMRGFCELNFLLMDIHGDGVEDVMDGKSTVDELCLMQE